MNDLYNSNNDVEKSQNMGNSSEIKKDNEFKLETPKEDSNEDNEFKLENTNNVSEFRMQTSIDDKVTKIDKQDDLPENIAKSFQNGEYRTVVTDEPITVYRVFGNEAHSDGCFCTTEKPFDSLSAKTDNALKQEYMNSKQYYEEITIPAGEKLNIGKVGEQDTRDKDKGGQKLEGGNEQVLLPQDWAKNENYVVSEAQPLEVRPFQQLVQAEKDIHESNKNSNQ